MSEFRQNPATGEWVVIATERAKRPHQFVRRKEDVRVLAPYDAKCPFCPGNESMTPPEVVRFDDAEGRWMVRVVPNKFAALQPEQRPVRSVEGLFRKVHGFGVAEVVIESPLHNQTLALMRPEEVEQVVRAYMNRQYSISSQEDVAFVNIFRNHGPLAGTSLEHPHSQVIASAIVPPRVREQISFAMKYYDTHGQCAYCDMIEAERRDGGRIVLESEHFVALCPFASRSPYEIRILPIEHSPIFGFGDDRLLKDYASVLRRTLLRLYRGLNDPDYNFIIRVAPVGDESVVYYHWYTVIVPKLTTPAGFEMGTGIYINVALPEACAEALRSTPETDPGA